MPRFPVYRLDYLEDARRLGVVPGTPAWRDVKRARQALEREELPGPGDRYTYVPDPDESPNAVRTLAHVRRVPRRNLWIWYIATGDGLQLVALTDEPP